MDIIKKVKMFFEKLRNNKNVETVSEIFPIGEIIEIQVNEEEKINREEYEIINVSENLREYLNLNMLYAESIEREIRKCDIQKIITLIKRKNESRTNEIRIDSDIVDEFISLIEQEIEEVNFSLGELEIDISGKEFGIKDFVEKHKKMSYTLKFKITSLKDLKDDEIGFLKERYGIKYIYVDEEYHLDELVKIIEKLKELIPNTNNNDLETAQKIVGVIFKRFLYYEPLKYEVDKRNIVLLSGETLKLPSFNVLENTSYYASIKNIFKDEIASEMGFIRICRETLKLANFNIIDKVESVTNTIKKPDVIIDDIKYRIEVSGNGIQLVK